MRTLFLSLILVTTLAMSSRNAAAVDQLSYECVVTGLEQNEWAPQSTILPVGLKLLLDLSVGGVPEDSLGAVDNFEVKVLGGSVSLSLVQPVFEGPDNHLGWKSLRPGKEAQAALTALQKAWDNDIDVSLEKGNWSQQASCGFVFRFKVDKISEENGKRLLGLLGASVVPGKKEWKRSSTAMGGIATFPFFVIDKTKQNANGYYPITRSFTPGWSSPSLLGSAVFDDGIEKKIAFQFLVSCRQKGTGK